MTGLSELDILTHWKSYAIYQARRYLKAKPQYAREWAEEARRWSRLVVRERRYMRSAT
jgi:hypothetical protein